MMGLPADVKGECPENRNDNPGYADNQVTLTTANVALIVVAACKPHNASGQNCDTGRNQYWVKVCTAIPE